MKKLAVFLIIISFACTQQKDYNLSNRFGGFHRNNNYPNTSLFIENYKEIVLDKNKSGAVLPPIAIDYQTVIIPGNNGEIHKVTGNILKWSVKLDDNVRIASTVCVDNLGNVYVAGFDGSLYSYDSQGSLRWKCRINEETDLTETYSNLLALPDGIIAAGSNGSIIKTDFKGNIIWSKVFDNFLISTFPGKSNGAVLLPVTKNKFGESDSLLYIDKSGKILKSIEFENLRILSTPIISNDKYFISGVRETTSGRVSEIICLDTNFNELWTKKMALVIKSLSSDDEGNLYITGYNSLYGQNLSGVFKLSPDSEVLWQIYLETSVKSPVIISKNLLSVTGSSHKENTIFFLRKDDGVVSHSIVIDAEAPQLLYDPAVLRSGAMLFAATSNLSILRTIRNIDELE